MTSEFKCDLNALLLLCLIVFLAATGMILHHSHNTQYWKSQYIEAQQELETAERAYQARVTVMRTQLNTLYFNTMQDNAELVCLANNIFFESGNQSRDGQLAVAAVTINRANSNRFPNTICEVVHQRNMRGCQFSWVCEDHAYVPIAHSNYQQAFAVALEMLSGTADHVLLDVPDALWYHADYVNPWWNQHKVQVSRIGNHIFYRDGAR